MSITVLCDVCRKCFTFPIEEEMLLFHKKRMVIENNGIIRRKYICNNCYKNKWKFNERGEVAQ